MEKIQIVTNSIKQIIVVENTVVFILLLISFSVKLLRFLKYTPFNEVTTFINSPDNDQKIKNVAIKPYNICNKTENVVSKLLAPAVTL